MHKKILITGSSGFIGSNFIRYLQKLPRFNDKYTYFSLDKNTDKTFIPTFCVDLADATMLASCLGHFQPDYIVNFASYSDVYYSIRKPWEYMTNNVQLMTNLLNYFKEDKVTRILHISCYDEETRVLTPYGFRKYNEVKAGDFILTLNSNTGFLESKKILETIVQDYSGPMYHFNYGRTDVKVTPNHRMFYEKDGVIDVESAETLCSKTYHYRFPKAKWEGCNEETVHVDGVGDFKTEDLFYLCGLYIGDGFCDTQKVLRENKTGLTRKDWLQLSRSNKGRFVKLPKLGPNDFTTCTSHRLWFDIPESDLARPKLYAVLQRLGIKYSIHKNKSGEHVYCGVNEHWIKFFKQFGEEAKEKHIPVWMLKHSTNCLRKLFDGLIDSDGRSEGTKTLSTCSQRLVENSCELGIKLGYFPHYKYRESCSYYQNRCIKGWGYAITFCSTYTCFGQQNLSIVPYTGKIWCLRMEDNKNFIVERNGNLAICGNTDEVYGESSPDSPATTKTLLNPTNPYSASKAAQEMICQAYRNTYGMPITIINLVNNFGPNQDKNKFIPKAIQYIKNGWKLPIHADLTVGDEVVGGRCWIPVEMTCKVLWSLIEGDYQTENKIHLGGFTYMSNLDIAYKISKILNKPLSYELVDGNVTRPGHDLKYFLQGSNFFLDNMVKAGYSFDEELEKAVKSYV